MGRVVSSRRKKRRGNDHWFPTPAQSAVAAVLKGPTPDDVEEADGVRDVSDESLDSAGGLQEEGFQVDDPLETEDCAHAEDASESPALQIATLSEELQEKDELVAALTSQLEEAANRLDRLHRAGADRIPRGGTSSADRDDTGELSEQVSRLTAAWEELRAADALAEISRKLDEVQEALTQPGGDVSFARELPPAPSAASARSAELQPVRAAWEDMKAQLLRNEAQHERTEAAPVRTRDVNDSAADVLSQIPLDPPAAVDLQQADREMLAAAVEERDVFISHLIRRLRSGPAGRYEPIDWSALAAAPDDLRERLQELEARLQELLRIEECDMSLERARLARERARLEQLRRDVERDARIERSELATMGDDPTASQSERRWLRAFGFGRKQPRPE